jgi:hypothetical protein
MTDVPPIFCESLEYLYLVPLIRSSNTIKRKKISGRHRQVLIHDWLSVVHITSGCKTAMDASIVSVRENTPVTASPFSRSVYKGGHREDRNTQHEPRALLSLPGAPPYTTSSPSDVASRRPVQERDYTTVACRRAVKFLDPVRSHLLPQSQLDWGFQGSSWSPYVCEYAEVLILVAPQSLHQVLQWFWGRLCRLHHQRVCEPNPRV